MPFQNNVVAGASGASSSGGGGASGIYSHHIANSARMDTNNGYLHRTPSGAGNRATWTFSTWIKLSQMGTGTRRIYSAGSSGDQDGFYTLFYNANKLVVGSANANFVTPSNTFRDPSAWQHIVWKQGSNTTTLYVNGSQIATASVSGNTAVNNNTLQCIGTSSYGGSPTNTEHLDGYFAETIMIDGTALDADSFGETKNGVWIPKDASGLTYGTNGFRLSYGNASDLGEDSAGSNDWTAVNLATHDQTGDTPAFNSSSNGGNFATLGILWKTPDMTFSEGNLRANTTTNNRGVMSNWEVPDGDKWYWEIYPTIASGEQWLVGINYATVDFTSDRGGRATGVSYDSFDGKKRVDNNTASSYGSSWATGDIIGIAVDRVNDTIQFYKNGSGQGTIDISGLNNTEFFPWCGCGGGSGDNIIVYNFGAEGTFAGSTTAGGNADVTGYGNFKYDPGDYKALCAGNLPVVAEIDPAQDDNYPQKMFQALTYTGNANNSRAITTKFDPDVMWFKRYNGSKAWNNYSKTQGIGDTSYYQQFDSTAYDGYNSGSYKGVISTASTSMTIGAVDYINGSGMEYVTYLFNMGGSQTTNNDGSVTSYIYNSGAGMSVGKYTGESASRTVGHGLGVAPSFIIVKSIGAARNWAVYYGDTGKAAQINNYNAADSGSYWNSTAPTSSVFSVADVSETGKSEQYMFMAFANTEGFIKGGTYSGNGNADGTFVYTGFKPAFIMCKRTDSSSFGNWRIIDSARSEYNPADKSLLPNSTSAQETGSSDEVDLLSNGFKLRNSQNWNSSGTYLFLAIADVSAKYATAR